jgi:hypothetical protein
LEVTSRIFVPQIIIAVGFVSIFPSSSRAESGLKFGGVSFAPGSTVQASVPLNAQERIYANEGGNVAPASAIAVLAVPANFDPRKTWPVFVVLSTSDFHHQDRGDLAQFYRNTALAEGWVLLAGDGPRIPRLDSAAWRAAMTLAAVDALHRSFPGSEKWPVICGGISGGARRAGFLAPLLATNGCHIIGIYLTGVNQDHLTDGYQKFQPGAGFLTTPVFIAAGRDDRTARLDQQYDVMSSIKRTGFQRVKIEIFSGGHEVKNFETRTALQWFRSLGNFPRN